MNTKNIIKKIFLVGLFFLLGQMSMAQQSVTKQINQIKRNPLYLYSEATMESEEEARSVAYELLMQQMQEYISSKRSLSQAENVLIKDIKSNGESLSMRRGTMYRVFVYVKKNDIEGVENTTVINGSTGATITINDENAPSAPSKLKSENAASTNTGVNNPTGVNIGATTPAQTEATPAPRQVAPETNPSTDGLSVQSSHSSGQAVEDSPHTSVPKGNERVKPPLSGWKLQAVYSLMECTDVTAVRAQLNRLKSEYKVKRYGQADNCSSPEDAFWIIFDKDGRLVTILGTGKEQRVDYGTMTYSSLDAYRGMNALWFTLTK